MQVLMLVDPDVAVGGCASISRHSGSNEEGTHAGGHAKADGGDSRGMYCEVLKTLLAHCPDQTVRASVVASMGTCR